MQALPLALALDFPVVRVVAQVEYGRDQRRDEQRDQAVSDQGSRFDGIDSAGRTCPLLERMPNRKVARLPEVGWRGGVARRDGDAYLGRDD